jgi:hypothetical protein
MTNNKSFISSWFELVKIIEVCVNRTLDDQKLNIRIELFKSNDQPQSYKVYVSRAEYFRIQPTFPQEQGLPLHDPCDEIIWVRDSFLWPSSREVIHAENTEAALNQVISYIASKFK